MGNQQSGSGGEGGKKNDKGEKKKYEPPVPTRVGKKRKKTKGPDTASKLPMITPHTKCRLRLLKQERIKDYLLMEEEFIRNQERLKPQEEKNEEERSKVLYTDPNFAENQSFKIRILLKIGFLKSEFCRKSLFKK